MNYDDLVTHARAESCVTCDYPNRTRPFKAMKAISFDKI